MLTAPLFPNMLHVPALIISFLSVVKQFTRSSLTKIAVCIALIVSESTSLYPLADSLRQFSHSSLFWQKNDIVIDLWHSCVEIQIKSGSYLINSYMNILTEFVGGSMPWRFHTPIEISIWSCILEVFFIIETYSLRLIWDSKCNENYGDFIIEIWAVELFTVGLSIEMVLL